MEDAEKGADAITAVMSIIETAKRNNLDVYGYLLLFINEPWMIDRTLPWITGFDPIPLPDDDNIRAYLPMDICRSAVLRCLSDVISRYGLFIRY